MRCLVTFVTSAGILQKPGRWTSGPAGPDGSDLAGVTDTLEFEDFAGWARIRWQLRAGRTRST
jgi:hypothetical protein